MTGKEVQENIGKNIKKYRKQKYRFASAAADRLGYSRQQLYIWESGRAIPQPQTMCDIATLLGIDVFKLYERNEDYADKK